MRTLIIASLVVLAAALPGAATLDGANLGTYISGPKLDLAQLKGQVVFWEYWGVNCPPCRASIKHMVELKHELGDQVVMVYNHCQNSDPAGIRKVWAENGGDDSITVVDFGQLPGTNVSGIPHCFLFDHTGKLVFDGSPFKVADIMRETCAKAPGALVADREWSHLKAEAFAIGRQQGPIGSAIKSVRKATEDDDAAVAAEANELLGRVQAWALGAQESVQADRSAEPLAAWETANTMAGLLKGDDLSDPFKELVSELKKDKAFQEELKAAAALAKIEQVARENGITGGMGDPKAAAACKKALGQIADRFEGTAAAAKAQTYMTEWKL